LVERDEFELAVPILNQLTTSFGNNESLLMGLRKGPPARSSSCSENLHRELPSGCSEIGTGSSNSLPSTNQSFSFRTYRRIARKVLLAFR
jgi:hypothetical protein